MTGVRNRKGVIRRRRMLPVWMLVFGLLLFTGCGGQSGSAGSTDDGNGAATAADANEQNGTGTAADTDEQGDADGGNGAETAADADEQGGVETAADASGRTGTETAAGTDGGKDMETAASAEKAVDAARREEEEAGGGAAAKKLSILGDSISTFDGWITEGYACYFPMSGEVSNVEQTWWKMVMKDTKMELCVNGSSSGSTCIGDSSSIDDFQYGCSECRIGNLIGGSGSFPDVIIVYMGTNDLLKSVPLGDNDGTRAVEEGIIENFSDAYCMILDKLIAYYPNAEIFCCNLPPVGDWGPETGPAFVTFVNGQELTSEDYGRQIEIIAVAKGCKIIDLKNCGITMENMETYVTDGVHMNPEGMKLIRDAVEAAL